MAVDCGPEWFFLRMRGLSMSPRFEDGEYLCVDPDEPAEPGRFVAIVDPATGRDTVRLMAERGGRRVLRTLAGDGPDLVLDRDNETMIFGTLVFKGSRIRRSASGLRNAPTAVAATQSLPRPGPRLERGRIPADTLLFWSALGGLFRRRGQTGPAPRIYPAAGGVVRWARVPGARARRMLAIPLPLRFGLQHAGRTRCRALTA